MSQFSIILMSLASLIFNAGANTTGGPIPKPNQSLTRLTPSKLIGPQLAIQREENQKAMIRQSYYDTPTWLSVHVGSQGLGVDGKVGINERFSLTIGASILPLGFNAPLTFQQLSADTRLDVDFFNAHVMANIYPIYNNSKIKIVPGIGYFIKANGDVLARPKTDALRFGEISISSEDVGTINGSANWKGIAPFLGAGWDDVYAMKDLRMSFLVGTYFLSSPNKINIVGTNLLQGNEVNIPAVKNNLNSYRWLPVLQVELNYGF